MENGEWADALWGSLLKHEINVAWNMVPKEEETTKYTKHSKRVASLGAKVVL